ncbi:MAG: DEAD/DEAH box helicase, partial [Verrucomicrobia bacterium]|nr:DEAD/DEAH box helicase [Verrucomicrobiota bacterium]
MKSKGRMIPKTHPDLVEMAVLAREMKLGRVEEVRMPTCSLDILCQQIVAMVAMEDWEVERLFGVIRRAAPYRDLSAEAFEQALELVSGRYRFGRKKAEGEEDVIPARASTLEALQPRISWDRVQQRLRALPGSHHISLVNGGAIPDTGNFAVIGPDGSRIGELDLSSYRTAPVTTQISEGAEVSTESSITH